MGTSISVLSDNLKSIILTKDKILPQILSLFNFEEYAKPDDKTMTAESLLNVMQTKIDVFLTHDWLLNIIYIFF